MGPVSLTAATICKNSLCVGELWSGMVFAPVAIQAGALKRLSAAGGQRSLPAMAKPTCAEPRRNETLTQEAQSTPMKPAGGR